jgi:hypothetical protein
MLDVQISRPFRIFSLTVTECGGSDLAATGCRYRRRIRLGWLSFNAGEFDERPVGSGAYWQALYEAQVAKGNKDA